jgi:hypothetical protein
MRECHLSKNGYALTGRVVDAKVEADGDIHIALVDANGRSFAIFRERTPISRQRKKGNRLLLPNQTASCLTPNLMIWGISGD